MSPIHDDDEILRRALAKPGPHVDDAGFTDRVMARLPPARERRRVRGPLLAASLAVGAGALALSPALPFVSDTMTRALVADSAPLSTLVASAALVATLLGASVFAFRPE